MNCPKCDQEMGLYATSGSNGIVTRRFYRCRECDLNLTIPPLDSPPPVIEPMQAYLIADVQAGLEE